MHLLTIVITYPVSIIILIIYNCILCLVMSKENPQNSQSPASKLLGLKLSRVDEHGQPKQLLLDNEASSEEFDEATQVINIEDWDDVFEEINENVHGAEANDESAKLPVKEYVSDPVVVKFPYEAYESQLQLMDGLIKGVLGGHNCLLESPTG